MLPIETEFGTFRSIRLPRPRETARAPCSLHHRHRCRLLPRLLPRPRRDRPS